MNKFFSVKMKSIIRDITILTALCLVLVFLWFSKGLIFAGGEEGIPFYDLSKTLDFVSYTWQDISAGYPSQLLLNRIPYFSFLKFFSSIGLPGFQVQALHFAILMIFGTLSIYFLLREVVLNELKLQKLKPIFNLSPLIGAIFYLINPFSMTQVWGRGLYMQYFPFALLPFFLLMFILGLKKRSFLFGLIGIIVSVFLAGSFGNPSYIFSLWVMLGIYLTFYVYTNRSLGAILFSVGYFLFMLGGWTAINMWWIYPFMKISTNQFSLALNNTEANLGAMRGISKDYQLPSLLRLIHEGYFYRGEKYGSSYTSLFFGLISWIIPVASLFSYSVVKKMKTFLFLAMFFLFTLFISLGANFPSGKLFELIFITFPVFQSFRNPFEKFGIILTIAYAPFFAVGIIMFSQKVGNLFKSYSVQIAGLIIMLVLVFRVFLWPMWTGQFAGGLVFNPWVQVPDYYKSLDDWLLLQPDDGRIIQFPINPGDGVKYSGWDFPYQGIEPAEYIFSRPSIGGNGLSYKSYYNVLLQRFNNFHELTFGPDPDISKSEFRSSDLFEELAKLNVRYIILHRDIDPDLGKIGGWESVAKYLADQPDIEKVKTFGKLDIYKVKIPEDVHLIYSPEIKVSYVKINPTLYKVTAENNTKDAFNLYLLENYDSNWSVYVDGRKIENQEKAFSYANKWKIDQTGNLTAIVKYQPQDYVEEGMNITKKVAWISVSLIVVLVIVQILWKRKADKAVI